MLLGGDLTNNSNPAAYANATGLSFAVEANKTYRFDFELIWRTTVTTSGCYLAVAAPSGATVCGGGYLYSTLIGGLFGGYFRATDTDGVATGGMDLANQNVHGKITGTIINGANAGTLQLRFKNETAGQTLTIKAGSSLVWYQLN